MGLGSPKANSVWISKRYACKARHHPGEAGWGLRFLPSPLMNIAKCKYLNQDFKLTLQVFSVILMQHGFHKTHNLSERPIFRVSGTACKKALAWLDARLAHCRCLSIRTAATCEKPHQTGIGAVYSYPLVPQRCSLWYSGDEEIKRFRNRKSALHASATKIYGDFVFARIGSWALKSIQFHTTLKAD